MGRRRRACCEAQVAVVRKLLHAASTRQGAAPRRKRQASTAWAGRSRGRRCASWLAAGSAGCSKGSALCGRADLDPEEGARWELTGTGFGSRGGHAPWELTRTHNIRYIPANWGEPIFPRPNQVKSCLHFLALLVKNAMRSCAGGSPTTHTATRHTVLVIGTLWNVSGPTSGIKSVNRCAGASSREDVHET